MKKLQSSETYWIADTASVIGDVVLGNAVSIWYGVVIRGDKGSIEIGSSTNIQDNAVIHEKTVIGKHCSVGHGAILHGCTVGDNTLIGMGAIIMTGAVIGKNCIVGAGSLVSSHTKVPDNSLAFGSPATVVRLLREEEIADNHTTSELYIELSKKHRDTK